ncbi:MAG: hypothetical protein ABJA84_00060 [Polaromonas sp.]
MAILEGDIKLLKSAVMADTSDGGGAMTGVAVIDGQSNNLFPDTSEMNRALGNVALRKLFGVAHTDNVDTLLGSHAIITDAPDDPLVHCTLMRTSGWADNRTTAKEVIERYVLKGSRMGPRLLDTHYEGSLQVRLFSPSANTNFPKGGDAICLAAPDGYEQYVRVTKITFTSQTFFITEGNGTVEFTGTIGTCELGARLDHDFVGVGATRIPPAYAGITAVYNTTYASGAQFYGIKPLTTPATVGDLSAVVSGIFTPLVPAATIETPIIDQFPFLARTGLTSTATGSITTLAVTVTLNAGATLTAPTPIRPTSITLSASGTLFTDDGLGSLKQGTLIVGSVDYKAGRITMLSTSPNYGSVSATLTYTPATVAALSLHSSYFSITQANQGLSFTNVLSPLPAQGSARLSYMAQGRWYELTDNMQGKLSGGETGYGTGTVNYDTGSLAVTLGAIPDVGSALILDWGEKATAAAVDPARLPVKLGTVLALNSATIGTGMSIAWSRAGVAYSATATNGVVGGDATGYYGDGKLLLEPNVIPDSSIVVNSSITNTTIVPGVEVATETTGDATYRLYQLPGELPIAKNTFKSQVVVTFPEGSLYPENPLPLYDRNGVVWLGYHGNKESGIANQGSAIQVGIIDYATGVLTLHRSVSLYLWMLNSYVNQGTWVREEYKGMSLTLQAITLASIDGLPGIMSYAMTPETAVITAVETTQTLAATTWSARTYTAGPDMLVDGAVFRIGGENYTSAGGILRKGWNIATGAPVVADAGLLTGSGALTVTSPPANGVNGITWVNAVQNTSVNLSAGGVFRTANAPLKTGVMQLLAGAKIGSANDAGVLSGDFSGTVDFQRGIVKWVSSAALDPATLSYNAVFLQYLPLNGALLGLETARLPLDGRVPIYRSGDIQVVHNTQSYALPNPLVKGTVYDVGRVRVAAMKVKTATGATVDTTKYTADLDAGTITFPVESDLTGLAQPFAVEHRIEDLVVCSVADISGKLTFTRSLTHDYPANTSFVSSALLFGDVFARVYNPIEQATWTGVWSDVLIGSAPTANFNEVIAVPTTTNRGAIAEQWALIFANTTAFRIVGRSVGEIGTGNTATDCSPLNPATNVPYFTIPALGWGSGWAAGNVYRFNTAACGAPLWVVRTVLQGPATLQDDRFTLAFRGDVDRP